MGVAVTAWVWRLAPLVLSWVLCWLSGNRRWLGGNAPENHSSGLLDSLQALAEKISVSMPELDVIGGSGSRLKPDCLADHEGHGFCLGFADLLGRQGATVAPVQHLVGLCCAQHKPTYVEFRLMLSSHLKPATDRVLGAFYTT
jgi:hypothetical protein